MKIKYLGHSCFIIETSDGLRILTDPYKGVGYELPENLQADITLISHAHFDHNNIDAVTSKFVLQTAGEYEFLDLKIKGIESNHDDKGGTLRGKNIIFTIQVDGYTLCHFGDLGEPCSQKLLAKIGKVDILLIPIGGRYTIDAKQAKKYVEEMQPKLVIPMHYKPKDGTIDITDASEFLSLFESVVYVNPKYEIRIEKDSLTNDKTQIIYMEREEK